MAGHSHYSEGYGPVGPAPKEHQAVYTTLHSVLAEKIPLPDLVVYLRANIDVLVERIAIRDRTYERAMSRGYLVDVAAAYDKFFSTYTQTPILTIDTTELNIVRNAADLASVTQRIRSALGAGTYQRPLLEVETPAKERGRAILEGRRRRLSDLQSWRRAADKDEGEDGDVYHQFLSLQAQLGALATELGRAWAVEDRLVQQVGNRGEAQTRALQDRASVLKGHLAGSLAGLLRLANGMGISLEEAYLARIREDCGAESEKGEA